MVARARRLSPDFLSPLRGFWRRSFRRVAATAHRASTAVNSSERPLFHGYDVALPKNLLIHRAPVISFPALQPFVRLALRPALVPLRGRREPGV